MIRYQRQQHAYILIERIERNQNKQHIPDVDDVQEWLEDHQYSVRAFCAIIQLLKSLALLLIPIVVVASM